MTWTAGDSSEIGAGRQGTFVPRKLVPWFERRGADALPCKGGFLANYGGLHRAARESRDQNQAARPRYMAEPVLGLCDYHPLPGVHLGMPKDRFAGLRNHYH